MTTLCNEDAAPALVLPDVLIMMGLPGSGKTTWWRTNMPAEAQADALVFCYNDALVEYEKKNKVTSRMAIMGDLQNQVRQDYIGTCYEQMLDREEGITEHPLIVVDNINVSALELSFFIMTAHSCGLRVHLQCLLSTEADIERLAAKTGCGRTLLRGKMKTMYHTLRNWPRNFPFVHTGGGSVHDRATFSR